MTTLPTVTVSDPLPGRRRAEPIFFSVEEDLPGQLWRARTSAGKEVLCQRLLTDRVAGRCDFVAVLDLDADVEITLVEPVDTSAGDCEGITVRDPQESDAVARLDTGYFDLELCRGTAQGTGASKWGLRHFSTLDEGIDLLPQGNNAIGGFYGPFFTPENGLINPPEHVVAEVAVLERGPLLHRYRFSGVVPDGLLPELRGKRFTVDWQFTYGTPWFSRRYSVDDFQTVINGRSVTDKITVGDEFESGAGEAVFTRFEAYEGTRYRAGDPYAKELEAAVADALATDGPVSDRFESFRSLLSGDLGSAHWDLYWRPFSTWESALDDSDLDKYLQDVRSRAHVAADLNNRPWTLTGEGVDASAAPDQTIFAGPATKTTEYHPDRDRTMVWWTSQASGAFQIVQRPPSGWVNWGTNGENECPELPVGADIKTAYGRFAQRWTDIADQLEAPPTTTVK